MITAHFNKHDLLCCIEGFARGSHLRQHIWEKVIMEYLPQMEDHETDFIWYYSMRDLFECYFGFGEYPYCGAEDFIHAMAALDRRNYANVKYVYNGVSETELCYRFGGHWRPFNKGFNTYLADEYIMDCDRIENTTPQLGNDSKPWHMDVNIYDMDVNEIHKLYRRK